MAEEKNKQLLLDKLVDLLDVLILKIKELFLKILSSEQYKKVKPQLEQVVKVSKEKLEPVTKILSPYYVKVKNVVLKLYKSLLEKLGILEEEDFDIISQSDGNVSSDSFVKTDLSETDRLARESALIAVKEKKAKKVRLLKKIFIVIIFIVLLIKIIFTILDNNKRQKALYETMKKVQTVRKMDITSQLSGSGTLSPKDSYTITSLVEGKVIDTYFDEGDKVDENQLLFTIDSSSAERSILTASASLAQANDSYMKAKKEYEDLEKDYSDNTFKSPYTGYLRTINIKKGDKLSNNTEIATIIDSTIVSVKIPFLSKEATQIKKGDKAVLNIQENNELIDGVVESVANEKQVLDAGSLVSYVTITCQNPGAITENNNASAIVNGIYSVGDGGFKFETNKTIVFSGGNGAVVEELLCDEGTFVNKDEPIFKITDDTIIYVTQTIRNNYLSAQKSLIQAQTTYDNSLDDFDEYYITAPIQGTVISKNVKVGDKIQNKSSQTTTLAIIYDLSELSFEMDIDELDISSVKIGQDVVVSADAFGNKKFKGKITEISLVANNSNGVTNYPVTVSITDTGDLLPGMNVDGYIVLEEAKDAIVIPSDALQRGNVVYVLNSSKTITSKNYSTDGVSDRVKNSIPDGFTAVSVEVGISNDDYVQILSGLDVDDKVYVTTSSTQNNFFRMGGMGGMGGPGGMGGGRR